MSSRFDADSSLPASSFDAARRAGCWTMKAGRALSLRPRHASILEIAQGRAWVTLHQDGREPQADWVLVPGSSLHVPAGAHVVMEPWEVAGEAQALAFRWDGVADSGLAWRARAGRSLAVGQSWRDLRDAARRGAAGLAQAASAAADALRAAARLAWGLLGWWRTAPGGLVAPARAASALRACDGC